MIFGGSVAPSGWLFCHGQSLLRTEYPKLFACIGIAYGIGDDTEGGTTFNVPDLRECVPVGIGSNETYTIASHDEYTLGQFKDDQFQIHGHSMAGGSDGGSNWVVNRMYSGNAIGDTVCAFTPTKYGDNDNPRYGTTTHGKQIGVNYIIKY